MKDADKTIAQIFWNRVAAKGDAPLFVYHLPGDFPPYTHRGRLRTMSWSAVGRQVRHLAMGLLALGARKGDAVCIMADTSPEWVMADLALLSIGGCTGSIYPNNLPAQARHIINDLDARFVFVQGRERRDGLLSVKAGSPRLEKIVTIGCAAGDDPLCTTFEDLAALGESLEGRYAADLEAAVAAGRLSDVASFIYTSGTTGEPKGAVHTHASVTYTVCTGAAWLPIEAGWTDFCFLPMAHIFEQFAGPLLDIYRGDVTIAFARGMATVAKDFGWVKPHFCRTAPRLFEKMFSTVWSQPDVLLGLSSAGLDEALQVSRRVAIEGGVYGREVSEADVRRHGQLSGHHYKEFNDLALGGRMRFFVSGGAPLSREINEFFWCLGLPVYELYGMTETGGATTNRPGHVRPGTVGKSWPGDGWPGGGGQTRLSPEGEILVKGPNVTVGYHKKPEATAEAIRDGWMHSGDVAEIDEEGFFRITDRIKDILITAGGKNVAPQKIEGLLKQNPLISQAMVYGDGKHYLTALITLDEDEVMACARKLRIPGAYREVAAHPRMRAEVAQVVRQTNEQLARYETIKNFVLLDHDLSIETGDLTPTLKLKRKAVIGKYGDRMEALYRESPPA